MAIRDVTAQRLFVETALRSGAYVECAKEQAHYLRHVLRLEAGDAITVFNGRDGEWCARLEPNGKRSAKLAVETRLRAQEGGPDLYYLFAPLKRARLDYMVQKAVEMGVARLSPVLTRRTIAERVNLARMRSNAIEAAEQCGILRVPLIDEPRPLAGVLAGWDARRPLVFCDEGAQVSDPVAALGRIEPGPLAVLIGPEGGFDSDERDMLIGKPYTVRLRLGPRIMRADTAAVAALALVNAHLGDWR